MIRNHEIEIHLLGIVPLGLLVDSGVCGMSGACECLAMWVDSEPCICNEPIGAPMEVSAKRLAEANRLVREVQEIDRAIESVSKSKPFCSTRVRYDSYNERSVELYLPHDITLGLLRTMRFQTLVKLAETGVTSMATGYRPVVSA